MDISAGLPDEVMNEIHRTLSFFSASDYLTTAPRLRHFPPTRTGAVPRSHVRVGFDWALATGIGGSQISHLNEFGDLPK
jgi:hypothetical protein